MGEEAEVLIGIVRLPKPPMFPVLGELANVSPFTTRAEVDAGDVVQETEPLCPNALTATVAEPLQVKVTTKSPELAAKVTAVTSILEVDVDI